MCAEFFSKGMLQRVWVSIPRRGSPYVQPSRAPRGLKMRALAPAEEQQARAPRLEHRAPHSKIFMHACAQLCVHVYVLMGRPRQGITSRNKPTQFQGRRSGGGKGMAQACCTPRALASCWPRMQKATGLPEQLSKPKPGSRSYRSDLF